MLLKLLIPLHTSAVEGINQLCLMNYSNTAKYSIHEYSANCAVKDVKNVLEKLLFPLQTSAVEGINQLCIMNYSNTAKIQYI